MNSQETNDLEMMKSARVAPEPSVVDETKVDPNSFANELSGLASDTMR